MALISQLLATKCGLGLTFDSHLYLEGADFFRGVTAVPMAEMLVFRAKPPLFSLILAFFSLEQMRLVFVLLLLANLLLIGRLIAQLIHQFPLQIITFLSIALFAPHLMVYVYLWTEPIFLFFFFTALHFLIRQLRKPITKNLIGLVVTGLCLVMTRHTGIFFIFGFSLALFMAGREYRRHALVYLLSGVAIFALWNLGVGLSGMGERLQTLTSPITHASSARAQNFVFYYDALSKWFLPGNLSLTFRSIILALVFTGGLVMARIKMGRFELNREAIALLIIGSTYYLMMHMPFLIDPTSAERYILPVYPVFMILLFMIIDRKLASSANIFATIVILLFIWLSYPVLRIVKNVYFWQDKLCQENTEIPLDLQQN